MIIRKTYVVKAEWAEIQVSYDYDEAQLDLSIDGEESVALSLVAAEDLHRALGEIIKEVREVHAAT